MIYFKNLSLISNGLYHNRDKNCHGSLKNCRKTFSPKKFKIFSKSEGWLCCSNILYEKLKVANKYVILRTQHFKHKINIQIFL